MFSRSSRSHLDSRPRFVRVVCDETDPECPECGDYFPKRRLELGFKECLSCSKEQPKVANLTLHKQAYGYTHDVKNLGQNPYSTHK